MNNKRVLLGLLGFPLGHTLSPQIHTSFGRSVNLQVYYIPLEIEPEKIKEALQSLKILKFTGCNVTIPHKEKVLNFVDFKSEVVEFTESCNTLIFKEDTIHAHNTDWIGFLKAWKDANLCNIEGKFAVILGAGGTAKSILYALCSKGIAKVNIFNRDINRAYNVASMFKQRFPIDIDVFSIYDEEEIQHSLKYAHILINTTSVGMYPQTSKTPIKIPQRINKNINFFDVIYNPIKTQFVKEMEKYAQGTGG